MKTKYLMCAAPKKYRVRLFSSRVLGGYSSKFTVYAPSCRKAVMMACMASGVSSFVCLSKMYFGGVISLSRAMKILTSSKYLGMYGFATPIY